MSNTLTSLLRSLAFVCLGLFFLVSAPVVRGTTFQMEDRSHITNLHHIDDDLFIWSKSYVQDGVINGDLFCGGSEVMINGQINGGSANIFADNFSHRGMIDGSLRCFNNRGNIDGTVTKSLLCFARQMTINRSAVIGRDAHMFGTIISFEGNCAGDLHMHGEEVTIGGNIDGNVYVTSEHITFIAPLVIKGNLEIEAKKAPVIDTASGITIVGAVTVKAPKVDKDKESTFGFSDIVLMISKLLAAFLFGLLLMKIFREHTERAFLQLKHHFTQSLAVGVLSIVVFVLCALVLLVSIVLSLIGLILIGGDSASFGAVVLSLSILLIPITSFATVSGGLLFYIGKIIFALIIGCWLMRKMSRHAKAITGGQLFLGLLVLSLLFMIPIAGFWMYLFASIVGIGSIVLGIKGKPAAQLYPPVPPPPIPPVSPTEQE